MLKRRSVAARLFAVLGGAGLAFSICVPRATARFGQFHHVPGDRAGGECRRDWRSAKHLDQLRQPARPGPSGRRLLLEMISPRRLSDIEHGA
jgi:hypothetical protein